jgi:hypothetical protein
MRIILIVLLIVFFQSRSFAQCDEFARNVLQIIKYQRYETVKDCLMPIEQQREIMHWPNDSSTNLLQLSLQNTLKNQIILSFESLRDSAKSNGLNLSNAIYVACSRTEGTSSNVNIVFKVDKILDSFSVQTIQTDRIYISLPVDYNNNLDEVEYSSFTIVDGKKYSIFKPRADEIQKAKSFLLGELNNTGRNKIYLLCTNGLKNEKGEIFFMFLKINEQNSESAIILLNMDDLTYDELKD